VLYQLSYASPTPGPVSSVSAVSGGNSKLRCQVSQRSFDFITAREARKPQPPTLSPPFLPQKLSSRPEHDGFMSCAVERPPYWHSSTPAQIRVPYPLRTLQRVGYRASLDCSPPTRQQRSVAPVSIAYPPNSHHRPRVIRWASHYSTPKIRGLLCSVCVSPL